MATITAAVQSKLTNTAGLVTAFPGGFFADEALSTYGGLAAQYPYLEHGIEKPTRHGGNLEWAFGGKYVSVPLYLFKAYGVGSDSAEAAMTSLTGVFDAATLSITDGSFLSLQRLTEPYLENMQKLVGSRAVYRCVTWYEIAVQH